MAGNKSKQGGGQSGAGQNAGQQRKPQGGGGKGGGNGRRLQPRQTSAAQLGRQIAQASQLMRQMAMVKSIPTFTPTKEQRYTQGALKSTVLAPRGQGYYDAFVHNPDSAILSASVGPVTTMQGHSRLAVQGEVSLNTTFSVAVPGGTTITGNYSGNSKLLVFNCSSSDGVVGWLLHPSGVNNGMTKQEIIMPQLAELGPTRDTHGPSGLLFRQWHQANFGEPVETTDAAHLDGNPDALNADPARRVENIPLRLSVRIRNVTEALSVGGMVRILRYNGGLQFNNDSTPASGVPDINAPDLFAYQAIIDMIRGAQRTKHMGGHELTTTHQTNSYPADFIRSMTFETDITFAEGVARPSYNTVLILIDDFETATGGKNNSYEVNVVAQKAGRFSPGTLLYSKHGLLRSKADHHDKHKDMEECNDPVQQVNGNAGFGPLSHFPGKFDGPKFSGPPMLTNGPGYASW